MEVYVRSAWVEKRASTLAWRVDEDDIRAAWEGG